MTFNHLDDKGENKRWKAVPEISSWGSCSSYVLGFHGRTAFLCSVAQSCPSICIQFVNADTVSFTNCYSLFFYDYLKILIEVYLIYSVVLISSVQQSDSPMYVYIYWRKQWHPTPLLLPGIFHGWRSMVGYSLWGHKVSDMIERLHFLSLF